MRGLAHEPTGADQQGRPGLRWLDAHSPLAHVGASACRQRFTALKEAYWQVLDPLWSKEGKEGEKCLLRIHLENNPLNYSFVSTLHGKEGLLKSICNISAPGPFPPRF